MGGSYARSPKDAGFAKAPGEKVGKQIMGRFIFKKFFDRSSEPACSCNFKMFHVESLEEKMVATCTLLPYFFSNLDVTRWSQLFLGVFLVPQFHDKPTHASEYRLDVISSLDFDPIRHDETTIDWSGESCVSLRSVSFLVSQVKA